jgi:hypothetical protein
LEDVLPLALKFGLGSDERLESCRLTAPESRLGTLGDAPTLDVWLLERLFFGVRLRTESPDS